MAEDRFVTVDDEELNRILIEKDAVNTRRNTNSAVKLFRSYMYLKEKSLNEKFEEADYATLNSVLSKFYAEVRQENGEKYKKSSLIAIRHGINRFLQTNHVNGTVDIVHGADFKESKRVFEAVCKELKREGKGGFEHYPAIEQGDIKKMMDYFDINDNIKLLEKVFVDIMIYFGRRGRENMRDLKIEDFAATRDGDGNTYIYMVKDELTKNHQNDRNTAEGRMYARPDDPLCPVKTFMRYKMRRNPLCPAFFQRPKRKVRDTVWYDNVPIGHNTLGTMMKNISEKARLSKLYTNHSLRATAVSILDKEHFESRHIMSVTGHKAESSLKTYSGTSDAGTKKLMSDAISKNLYVGTSQQGKPAALGKPPKTRDDFPTCEMTDFMDFNFFNEEFTSNEVDIVDQILSTIDTAELELIQGTHEKENIHAHPRGLNDVTVSQVQSTSTNINSTLMPLMPLPNITNYGQITINYNVNK